jgi:tetratricopeptide (TPR) repeat protein
MKISELLNFSDLSPPLRFNGRTIAPDADGVIGPDGGLQPVRTQSLQVLKYLSDHAGQPVTKDALFTAVWPDTAVTDDSLTQCIGDIRRALGDTDRRVLETLPRKGFRLHPDRPQARRLPLRALAAAALGLVVVGSGAALWRPAPPQEDLTTLSLTRKPGTQALAAEVLTALDRYPLIRMLSQGGRFDLTLSSPAPQRFLAELTDTATGTIVLVRSGAVDDQPDMLTAAGADLANGVASLTHGAIAEALFPAVVETRSERLTNGECYLLYAQFDRTGREDYFLRSMACLQAILDQEPENGRALALLGDAYTEQYWYGTGLPDARDIPELRRPLARKALGLAQAAEAAGLPPDADSHLAVASVYYGNCMTDQLIAAYRRALDLRPDDPDILGEAGNHIAYAGDWELGVAMARRAVALSQPTYARWWYWAMGKDAWRKGDYQTALDDFMRGYEENGWHNHLHLAYTLPFLGRQAEAEQAVTRLRELWPGFTREDARRTHRRWCFDQAFIAKMDDALTLAGLPDLPQFESVGSLTDPAPNPTK